MCVKQDCPLPACQTFELSSHRRRCSKFGRSRRPFVYLPPRIISRISSVTFCLVRRIRRSLYGLRKSVENLVRKLPKIFFLPTKNPKSRSLVTMLKPLSLSFVVFRDEGGETGIFRCGTCESEYSDIGERGKGEGHSHFKNGGPDA